MNSRTKKGFSRLLSIPVLCIISLLLPMVASAELPYETNYRDNFNNLLWTQAAYAPDGALGRDIFIPDPNNPGETVLSPLSSPEDMYVTSDDRIFIADTGNGRVVVYAADGTFEKIITVDESPLRNPHGIFVHEKSDKIYIADKNNQRIAVINEDGDLLQEIFMPESSFIPSDFRFDPIKVAVDPRDFIYVVSEGSDYGLMMLTPDGEFQSFFGANQAPFSVLDAIKQFLYTEEMFQRQQSKRPPPILNVAVDDSGFIYTVSHGPGIGSDQVKKLNFSGNNFLGAGSQYTAGAGGYGEQRFAGGPNATEPRIQDIAIDSKGNFTVIDGALRYISQYDAFGNLLFFWSGDSSAAVTQLGIPKSPRAVAYNSSDELLVLDSDTNIVQKFRLTEFGSLVHTANGLTLEGRYDEARPYWEQVLQLNAYYTPAVLGIAQAEFRNENFAESRELFLEAGHQQGYSDSFWQIRLDWFQRNFALFMNILIFGGIGLFIFNFIAKRMGWKIKIPKKWKINHPLWLQIKHAGTILKHPIDGFTALRFENKGSYLSSIIILIGAYISIVLYRMFTSFTFNMGAIEHVNIFVIFIQFVVIFLGWVVCNYLVGSIMRGEARFKDVFMGTAYSLTPFIVVGVPLMIISQAMTLSEVSIFNFLYNGMIVWIALLIIWKVQNLQNYSVGETLLNIFVTILTMILLGVLLFILYGLFIDLRDFIYAIILEVSVR